MKKRRKMKADDGGGQAPAAGGSGEDRARLRSFGAALALIFIVALAIRSAYLMGLADTHLLDTLVGDAELYDIWAKEIISQGWIGEKVFFQAPFYPYFVAVIYAFFGPNLLIVRWIQVLIGAASCVLTAAVGRTFFSPKVGLLAGLLLSLYPVAVYYDVLIQKAVLGLFLTLSILYLLGRLQTRGHWAWWPAAGLLVGILVLVRENALILVPVVLGWLFIRFRQARFQRRLAWAVLFGMGCLAALFPVALRNHAISGEWFLTTSNLGFNLYMGNHAEATGTYTSPVRGRGDWRFESDDARVLAEKEVGRSLSPAEVSRYWTERALASIRSNMASWLKLLLKKWQLLWGALEMSDSESVYAYKDFSPFLRLLLPVFHFGILAPLFAVGVLLTWQRRRELWLLYAILAAYVAGILPFYVMARYRAPMLAVMMPFVAAGVIGLLRQVRAKAYLPLAGTLCMAAAVALYANWPVMSKSAIAATTYYNWASVFENEGRMDLALEAYREAVQRNPQHALALNNLGILYCRRGDYARGIRLFETALKTDPRMAKTHMNLAIAFYHTGRLADALHHFRETLRYGPDDNPVVHYNIACVLALQDNVAASLEALQKALDSGYDNWDQMLSDPDLANARRSPRFGALLDKARRQRAE
jgi:tetratricopeptide (TPR) repeat protein